VNVFLPERFVWRGWGGSRHDCQFCLVFVCLLRNICLFSQQYHFLICPRFPLPSPLPTLAAVSTSLVLPRRSLPCGGEGYAFRREDNWFFSKKQPPEIMWDTQTHERKSAFAGSTKQRSYYFRQATSPPLPLAPSLLSEKRRTRAAFDESHIGQIIQ